LSQHSGLRFNLLGGKDAGDWRQVRVAVHELEVARELLNAIDIAATLDFDGNGGARGIPRQNIYRADGGHVFAALKAVALAGKLDLLGQELLQVSFDTIFLQAGVDTEVIFAVVDDLVDRNNKKVSRFGLRHLPDLSDACLELHLVRVYLRDGARRAHPVERLVAQRIGVHKHTAVGFQQQKTGSKGQMGAEAAGIVDGTAGNNKTHPTSLAGHARVGFTMMPTLKLTILGSSTPYPRPDNPCSGYLVQSESTNLWVDAGTGTLAELQRHISPNELDGIWVSHGHADHTADLLTAYYALRFSELTPARPIPLFGPPGLTDQLVGFLGHRSRAVLPEVVEITEMRGWDGAAIGDLALEWGPVDHGMPAFGLRVTQADAVFAYSGDTSYCESAVELAEGAGLFLCEVGAAKDNDEARQVHCSPTDAARIATNAGARQVVLTHITAELGQEAALAQVSSLFNGSVDVARPGSIFAIDGQ
jgi:ribonuclease BN (tRNA processing enzyme)